MPLTRRTLLAAASATAASSAVAPGSWAQAPAAAPRTPPAGALQQAPGFYRYKVGDITVTAVNDGVAMRPLEGFIRNAELGAVQDAMKQAFLPTNALPIPFTPLALQMGGKTVLIDTGNGDVGAPTTGMHVANLRAAGIDPAQVSTVIISHFHADHISGLRLKDGTAVYPNAEVMVPATEWAYWMDDAKMAAAPDGLKPGFQNVRRVFGPMAKDVKRFEADQELVPGVSAVAAYGHTPGHTAFTITSGNARLMTVVDITNHPALFVRNPDWSAVFDMDADMARQTRRRMLDMAASERLQVAFYHAPFPATGHIAKDGNRFELVPVQWTPVI